MMLALLLPASMLAYGQTLAPTVFTSPITVGSSSGQKTVTVGISQSGVIASVRVVSSGTVNLDYSASSDGTCASGSAVNRGDACSLSVTFQPKYPGRRSGAVLLLDASNAVLGTELLSGTGLGSLAVFSPGTIQTIAGNGSWLYREDNVQATQASIYLPGGIAVAANGDIYIADTGNNRIRKVDSATGLISTIAGTGTPGYSGDGGLATLATLSSPGGLAISGTGDIYVADSSNHAIRKISLLTGVISSVAGIPGTQGNSGNGGLATAAQLNTPQGITFDSTGNLYIADTGNDNIRVVNGETGIISHVAGMGVAGFAGDGSLAATATLNSPWGLAVDSKDNLYIADLANNRIREISDGTISTVVGDGSHTFNSDGQTGLLTSLNNPAAVAFDVAGNMYIGDAGNNRVRRLSRKSSTVSTVAGTGSIQFTGDEGDADLSGIYGPYALAFDQSGNLYISDIFHHRIRRVQYTIRQLTYDAIRVGRTSDPKLVTVENTGNDTLQWTSMNPDLNSTTDPTKSTCTVGTDMAVSDTCVLAVEFMPQTVGNPISATLLMKSNAANSPNTVNLSGQVEELEPTKTALASNPNPSTLGVSVTFTAVVTGSGSAPTGTVRFLEGSTILGTGTLDSSSTARFSTSTLSLGSHSITAAFLGDTENSPSTSIAVTQVVQQLPAVTISSNNNPSKVGESVKLSATVTASQITPTGTVQFMDGNTTVGTANLDGSGNAAVTTNLLAAGSHTITAVYSGDTNSAKATSAALTQTVNKWSSTVLLTTSNASVDIGEQVTFSIQVIPTSSTTPSGSVQIKDGSATITTITLDSQGKGTYTGTLSQVGNHTMTASFLGDNTNDAATSAALAQTVTKISTTTSLTSSANPAKGNSSVVLTATVNPSTTNSVAGALSGNVVFKEGTSTLGTVTLSATGTASLSLSSLSIGTHNITATYEGNSSYDTSTSSVLAQQVSIGSTTTQLTSSLNPSIAGKSITFTTVVSGESGIPTGTVTLLDNGSSVATAQLNTSGQANFTLSSFSAATHSLTARYEGDAKNSSSTSPVLSQVVNQAKTSLLLTSSSNPATAGTAITFIATMSSDGDIPSGNIVLREGSTVIGTSALSATGAAQFSISTLSAGTHTLVASYAGDAGHTASDSAALVQTVALATSKVTLASSKNPATFGDTITFTLSVTGTGSQPGGTVQILDGNSVLATLPVTSGAMTYATSSLAIGSHTITAQYEGDTTHSAATPVSLTQRVLQETKAVLASSKNPAVAGDSIRLTATVTGVSGNAVSGTVTFSDAGVVLGTPTLNSSGVATLDTATLAVGTHSITASYSGDTTDAASVSAVLQQAVNTTSTSVTLVSSANPSVAGSAVQFTATVTSNGAPASGQVQFVDGSSVLGSVNISSGTAAFSTSALSAGQHSITARYVGSNESQASTSAVLLQVVQAVTQIALNASPNPALAADTVTLQAAVSGLADSGGTVTFYDGVTALGTTGLSNGQAAFSVTSITAGSHVITAVYSGDTLNLASTSSAVTVQVNKRASTTVISASSSSYKNGEQITLIGVVKFDGPVVPTGTITFTSNGTTLGTATVSDGGVASLTILASQSSYSVVASYSGDAVYAASQSTTYELKEGTSTTFDMSLSPSSVTLNSGDHTGVDITFTSSHQFADTLALGCLELPNAATCTFAKTSVVLPVNGSVTIHMDFDTGNPLGAGPRATTQQSNILWPIALMFGCLLFAARRKRRIQSLLMLALLAVVGITATGCGTSLQVNSTPAGSYTVRVMATGTTTGISQVGTLSVDVK